MALGWGRGGCGGGGGGGEERYSWKLSARVYGKNYCMQPLCYFRLKMWLFFSPSIRHHLQAYTQFHKPNNDTVNHAAQVANTLGKASLE
mgnify:CR=1 FL=1